MKAIHPVTFFCLSLAYASIGRAQDVISLPARAHDAKSSQVVPMEKEWDGLVVCHGRNGWQQWSVPIKAAGNYYIHVEYASGEKRPVRLFIDDQRQSGLYLGRDTGGFYANDLQWETHGKAFRQLCE